MGITIKYLSQSGEPTVLVYQQDRTHQKSTIIKDVAVDCGVEASSHQCLDKNEFRATKISRRILPFTSFTMIPPISCARKAMGRL
jgi:hypothetical protein